MLRILKLLFLNMMMLVGSMGLGQSPAGRHNDVSDGVSDNPIYCYTQDTDGNFRLLSQEKDWTRGSCVSTIMVHKESLWAGNAAGLSKITIPYPNQIDVPTHIVFLHYRKKKSDCGNYVPDPFFTRRKSVIPATAALTEIEIAGPDYLSKGRFHFQFGLRRALPQVYLCTFDMLIDWADDQIKNRPAFNDDYLNMIRLCCGTSFRSSFFKDENINYKKRPV